MSISNKISEIKIIISGFVKDLEHLESNGNLTPLVWEELNIAADSIKQKLNTIYTEYIRARQDEFIKREDLEKMLAAKNEEIVRLNQSMAELKRSFSDVTLNISKAFIPGSENSHPVQENLAVEEDQDMDQDQDQDMDMEFIIENGISILDSARGKDPEWLTDNPGHKIETINQAITLNDKLLFLNELFNDDSQQYRLSLEKIDQMYTFPQVLEYTRASFPDWDEDSAAVYRFYMAVRRKFC
ncbi:MAG: hypothetical protein PHP30_07790 [Bacteroidales bacterium]|nr:hypothetical protein [Bacteroidales bacterium]MDD2424838.1 hypothetical protein [Bacteroidales bacterium]MDD3989978.1 hypothetical protein [Bacteroidales bacterium]